MTLSHSPNIVTDGLVLYSDAANPRSYPGTGTTWYDLSGHGNNLSINGQITFNSNEKRFDLAGINGTFSRGSLFPLLNMAVEVWFRSTGTTETTGTSPGLFGLSYGYRTFVYDTQINAGVDQANLGSVKWIYPQVSSFHNGDWHQYIHTVSPTEFKVYIDGSLAGSAPVEWTGATRWPTQGWYFGRDLNNSMYYFTGSISNIKIYNTFFNDNMAQYNFNALRGRYGI